MAIDNPSAAPAGSPQASSSENLSPVPSATSPDLPVRESDPDDLGLGRRLVDESGPRLLNPDGSFNVERHSGSFFHSLHLYHSLLTISWPRFLLLVAGFYFLVNLSFAAGYVLCGPGALAGSAATRPAGRLLEAFFFSVQTLSTIGYGGLAPGTTAANVLVTLEAITGLLIVALAAGLFFARFSRPRAKILFSDKAVIAPYHGATAFEFRIANQRHSQLSNIEATVVMTRRTTRGGKPARSFHPLKLGRDRIMFMPLHWVVVHPIDEQSPLRGVTREEFEQSAPEFLILLTAHDETFAQTVHVRSSYKGPEVVWDAKFLSIYCPPRNGRVSIDLEKIHHIERLPLQDSVSRGMGVPAQPNN